MMMGQWQEGSEFGKEGGERDGELQGQQRGNLYNAETKGVLVKTILSMHSQWTS